MTAGLPGVGIGGIFYLASALLMPVHSLVATLTGRRHEARWALALRQSGLALAILGALWATGWAIGWIVSPVAAPAIVAAGAGAAPAVQNAVRMTALLGSLGTLALVLLVVQLMRLLPARPTPHAVATASSERARPAA